MTAAGFSDSALEALTVTAELITKAEIGFPPRIGGALCLLAARAQRQSPRAGKGADGQCYPNLH